MPNKLHSLAFALAGIGLAFTAHGGRRPAPSGRRETAPPAAAESERGRAADKPAEIPKRGWKDIVVRTFKEFADDEIPMISAGVTFYALLAIFPGVGAFVALYGLFADVADVQRHLQALSTI